MNAQFNAKIWIVGLMLVGAQAVSAMGLSTDLTEQKTKEATTTQKPADKDSKKSKNPVPAPTLKKDAETKQDGQKGQETGKSTEESKEGENSSEQQSGNKQQDGKDEAAKSEGIIASVLASISTAYTNTKTLGSNMIEFGDKNRMFTALTFGVPAALAIAYKLAPNSVKRHWLYKKFKDEVPAFVKGALITAIPTAIWGYYFMHRNVVAPVAPAPTNA